MDAAQALADLTEISAQIEAAVLAQADGSVVASTFTEPSRGEELARAAADLVAAAGEAGAGAPELVQLQAATPRGSVFVVRDPRHLVAAITGTKPTVGLVFYDLKTCLRLLEQQEAEPAPEPPKVTAVANPEKETAKESKVGKATGTRRRATTKKKDADEGT